MQQSATSSPLITAEIQQLAEKNHLGEPVIIYDKRKNPGRNAWGMFMAGLVLVIFISITGIALLFFFPQIYELAIAIMMIIVLLLTVRVYRSAAIHRNDLLLVYDEGILSINGPEIKALHWVEIQSIARGQIYTREGIKTVQDIDTMTIVGPDETKYELDRSLPDHQRARASDLVERAFIDHKLPVILERYQAGQEIAFGILQISQKGIRDQNETLPWSSVESITVGPEWVTIREEGRTSEWFHKMLPDVPNARLLKEFMEVISQNPYQE